MHLTGKCTFLICGWHRKLLNTIFIRAWCWSPLHNGCRGDKKKKEKELRMLLILRIHSGTLYHSQTSCRKRISCQICIKSCIFWYGKFFGVLWVLPNSMLGLIEIWHRKFIRKHWRKVWRTSLFKCNEMHRDVISAEIKRENFDLCFCRQQKIRGNIFYI